MSQKDHFQRLPFASDLISMVKSLPTPFSFGLDADWGAGKTFFIENILLPLAKEEKLPCLVYDAFEHEKEDDVFLSLMTSILEQSQLLAKNPTDKSAIQDTIQKTAKVATAVGGILLNAGTRFLLKQGLEDITEKFTDSSPSLESFSDVLEKEVAKFLQDRLKGGQSYKAIKSEFQTSIKELACNLSEEHGKIMVIIDELDRCSPNHALRVLEATHHLLNTEGLIFMFSYNRDQLETLVEHAYGTGIKAGEYLQKFVTLNFKFPALNTSQIQAANNRLIQERAEMHNSTMTNNSILVNALTRISDWITIAAMTPRQIQQYTSITLMVKGKLNRELTDSLSSSEIAALIYWKLTKPRALAKLLNPSVKLQERLKIMEELQYDDFLPKKPNRAEYLADFLKEDTQMDQDERIRWYKFLQIFNSLS